ncbi:MAG: alpha/beta hydrolase [Gloeomargaritaceae cyanobacterium C42_A2020_066]|nr:alpha/beta hydrolase [Gloeomargaritaceae cyanobacterium C42_A2020_066]
MAVAEIRGVPHIYDLTPPGRLPLTLVFIHGWMLSRHYWQPLQALLAPDYQCLSYDLRGFGDSRPAAASSSYSLETYADDLVQLLETLRIQDCWLIGHSLGGSVALWTADRLPRQVQGVIGVNAGGGIYLKEEFRRFRRAGVQMVRLRPAWLRQMPGLDRVMARANVVRPLARSWGQQRVEDFVKACPKAAIRTLLAATTEEEVYRLPQVVARLPQPVYFLAGDQDTIMPTPYVRHLASFHSLFNQGQNTVVELPNCGHLAMLEHPKLVAEQIRRVVSQHCPV